jgi:hypothetical protein
LKLLIKRKALRDSWRQKALVFLEEYIRAANTNVGGSRGGIAPSAGGVYHLMKSENIDCLHLLLRLYDFLDEIYTEKGSSEQAYTILDSLEILPFSFDLSGGASSSSSSAFSTSHHHILLFANPYLSQLVDGLLLVVIKLLYLSLTSESTARIATNAFSSTTHTDFRVSTMVVSAANNQKKRLLERLHQVEQFIEMNRSQLSNSDYLLEILHKIFLTATDTKI